MATPLYCRECEDFYESLYDSSYSGYEDEWDWDLIRDGSSL